jgi:hypothetical protein
MSDPRLKQLKIKTGVLKRVGKEKLSYRNFSSFSLSFYVYFLGSLVDYNIFVTSLKVHFKSGGPKHTDLDPQHCFQYSSSPVLLPCYMDFSWPESDLEFGSSIGLFH